MVSASEIFQARNVALIGATDKSHWPKNIYANMIESGFEGNLWPINPRRDEIFGVKCYPDLHSTPRPADLALMIIPAAAIPETLASGAEVGLKSAVVYAAGFGDGGRPESIERGKKLKSQLRNLDISVCGPNCMGLVGIREKLYCYPHAHIRNLAPGPTALITQSGGTLSYYLRAGAERGITFSYAVSSGNEISLDLSDYINFCVDDPETKQICLFIEGIRKPEAFMRACGRALEAEKPIIAIKTGRSQKSRDAAQSHSGAVSGDYAGYEAVCERYGIINCETLEEMIEMTVGFQQRRWPRGPRVAFMTTSGGTVDLLHDYCEEQGTSVPDLNEATIEKIRPFVPSDCHI
ncbi:MAG: CoA-binding protein, partial [Pseudomonadota bacterium]|nr:CoA-binding protein [Pseudomonadota bacterium]